MASNPKLPVDPEALPIAVDSFANTPAQAVPLAGLLQDRPELADAELPRAEWQELLDDYLTSERT